MFQVREPSEETRASTSLNSVILSRLSAMDIKAPSHPKKESPLEGFPEPLCNLNLKETSEFVKALPMATSKEISASAQRKREGVFSGGQRRSMEASSTPGRPVFSFSAGNLSRKSIPYKWDDAEKWLMSGSCHESPAHVTKPSDPSKISGPNAVLHQKGDAFSEKLRAAADEKVTCFQGHVVSLDTDTAFHGVPSEVVLQDKFTDNVEPPCPHFRFSGPTKEGALFKSYYCDSVKDATTVVFEAQHRDIGTEMTPLGSVKTSRCHTPLKSSSPARHNTPADMPGSLLASNTTFDISDLKDCHFAKLQLSTQYDSMASIWSSREEEEAELSRSLRHSDMGGGMKSVIETTSSPWEDEERIKICIRYQIEEAKIQAWVNLQSAKAEAQSKKLEVKIQKMRSNLEEKLMKRMAIVERRAEEWRAAAQLQHSQQILRASEQAQKMKIQQTSQASCGCFPCNNHL